MHERGAGRAAGFWAVEAIDSVVWEVTSASRRVPPSGGRNGKVFEQRSLLSSLSGPGLPVCPSLCPSVLDANITVSVRPSVHPSPGPQPFSLESPQPENRIAASQPGCCRRNFTSLYFTYLHPQDYKQAGPARPSRRLPLLHSLARSLACVEIRVELSWVLATSFHLEQHLISSHLPGPEEPAYPSSGLEQDKHFLPAGVQDYDRGERTGSQLQMNRLSLRHDRLK